MNVPSFDLGVDPNALGDGFNLTGTQVPSTPGLSAQGALLTAGMFSSMFATIGNAISQSSALESQAAYKKQQSDYNAQMDELNAQQALQQGDFQAQQIRRTANNEIAGSRVNAAAAGIEVNSGSSRDVQNSIEAVSSVDILTTQNNAARKAYGFQVQADSDTTEGQIAENTGKGEATSTILNGGLTALGQGAKGFYYGSGGTVLGKDM